jgi:hypothetical protein
MLAAGVVMAFLLRCTSLVDPQDAEHKMAQALKSQNLTESTDADSSDRQTQQIQFPSFIELYSWNAERNGLQLELTGRLHRIDGTEDWLPHDVIASKVQAVLYKYHITCCPGHSVPLVVPLLGTETMADLESFEQDSWVRVVGSYREFVAAANLDELENLQSAHNARPAVETKLMTAATEPAEPIERLYPERAMDGPCAGIVPEANYPPGRP